MLQERARSSAPHPAIDALYSLFATLEPVVLRMAQRLLERVQEPMSHAPTAAGEPVADAEILLWCTAVWRASHGALAPVGRVRPAAMDAELLTFAWSKLRKQLPVALRAWDGTNEGEQEMVSQLRAAASSMDAALGLSVGSSDKPLLWRSIGHTLPPTETSHWEQLQLLEHLGALVR